MSPIPLLCLPFAGAGASFFRRWNRLSDDNLEIVPLQLPGREQRLLEEPCRTVASTVRTVLPDAVECVDGQPRVALFGHSLGAVVAFELALVLEHDTDINVDHLIVSGSPGPWTRRRRRATGLTDDDFVALVREFAGYSHPAIEDPDMRQLILPILRADVEMHEAYVPSTTRRLDAPIVSVRGRDDNLVSAADAAQWQAASTREVSVVELAGGHMYLVDHGKELLSMIAARVGRC